MEDKDCRAMLEIIIKQNELIIKQNEYLSRLARKADLYNKRSENYSTIERYYGKDKLLESFKSEASELSEMARKIIIK